MGQENIFTPTTDFAMDPTQYANSFQNVNPYSQQAANQLFGGNIQNFINQGLTGAGGGFNDAKSVVQGVEAGASIIVQGTYLEKNVQKDKGAGLKKIVDALKAAGAKKV